MENVSRPAPVIKAVVFDPAIIAAGNISKFMLIARAIGIHVIVQKGCICRRNQTVIIYVKRLILSELNTARICIY
jgi:hypothetical protein